MHASLEEQHIQRGCKFANVYQLRAGALFWYFDVLIAVQKARFNTKTSVSFELIITASNPPSAA